MSRDAEPLTPIEEAELRYWVRAHPPSKARWFARLLATVDAARVTTPLPGGLDARQAAYDALPAALGREPDDPEYALADAIVDALVGVPACVACGHPRGSHSPGGMCDGAGTECYCVRFPDAPDFAVLPKPSARARDVAIKAAQAFFDAPWSVQRDVLAMRPDLAQRLHAAHFQVALHPVPAITEPSA